MMGQVTGSSLPTKSGRTHSKHSQSSHRVDSQENKAQHRQQKKLSSGRGNSNEHQKFSKDSPSPNHSYIVTLDGITMQQLPTQVSQQKQMKAPYVSSGGGTRHQQPQTAVRGVTRDSQQSKQSR